MARKLITAVILLIINILPCNVEAKFNTDSIIRALNHVVDRRDTYFTTHAWRIDSVKRVLAAIPADQLSMRTQLNHQIFNMYRSFQSDSARAVVERELALAEQTGDPELIVRARGDYIFSYLSAGAFPDALEIARNTSLDNVSDQAKGDFYFICQRLYSDISVAQCDNFNDKYARASHAYADSVIAVLPKDSYKAMYCMSFKTLDALKLQEKIDLFTGLMNRDDIDNNEKAMIASILGDYYNERSDEDGAVYYKALSGKLDIESAKRETTSLRFLANLMFQQGNYNLAHRYINVALEDAEFFNAPHRKAEIATVLPLIESHRFDSVNTERRALWWALGGVVLMLVVLIVGIIFYIRVARKLSASNRLIAQRSAELQEANESLEAANRNVQESNLELQNTLQKLSESVKIKDEYLGYSFYAHSEYIKKIEGLYKLVSRKLKTHQYDDLAMTLRESDLRKEKEVMLREFDTIFLRLFPTFIERYKSLFPAGETEDPAAQDNNGERQLSPEMRIFALIRLGINEISKIATFLNYSINTVNTYKTRAKNRSILPNDKFEEAIMEIRSIS